MQNAGRPADLCAGIPSSESKLPHHRTLIASDRMPRDPSRLQLRLVRVNQCDAFLRTTPKRLDPLLRTERSRWPLSLVAVVPTHDVPVLEPERNFARSRSNRCNQLGTDLDRTPDRPVLSTQFRRGDLLLRLAEAL